ncbi:MAG: sugar phosphate nucleotidyltransferase [Candidatus Woesearchaeota archaeon]|jgi:NDP-sugar pyrophosphorylase family protein|nr:sugar phosphate nucleotidyltransferase [Candidatus Woesearchaeota archaeon]MDP7323685.1 sugar phosphate nucleotidyltransferase [Candidatus Woesearchaeota archaeon]
MKEKISITVNKKTLDEIDALIDNVFIRNRSHAIEHLVESSLGKNKVAVILAGGDPEQLRISPQEFRPTAKVANLAVIEKAVKKLRNYGFATIYVVAQDPLLTKIFEILKDGTSYGVKIGYMEERHAKGSAYSLKLLKGKISTKFLVVYSDIIFDSINIEALWNDHIKQNYITTLMLTTSSKPSEKGTVKMEGTRILEFTQKPKKSDVYLVFSPIFVADPEILEYDGNSLEYDIFPELAKKGLLQGHISSEKETHIHSLDDKKKVKT